VSDPVIEATDLVKTYGETAAVDGISFSVAPGESFGLLGPNGAGKSTTMRMVGAVSTRTSGELRSLGLERYEAAFGENEVDASVLFSLTGEDLKDLGVTLVGHRRKMTPSRLLLLSQKSV